MSIRNGRLYVDGEPVENTGSESICFYCKKAYKCKAYEDDYLITVPYYGTEAKVKFKDLASVSQICSCPINEFIYNSFLGKR